MSIKIIEFIALFSFFILLAIAIFSLYRENNRLKSGLLKYKNSNEKLNSELEKVKFVNESLVANSKDKSKKIEELQNIESEYRHLLGKHEATLRELEELKEVVDKSTLKLVELKAIQEKSKTLQDALREKEELTQKLKEEMSKEFKALSNELFEVKRKSLQNENRDNLKSLLEPFDKELKGFKERLETLNKEQNHSVSMLRGELLQIKELNKALSTEAKELTKALKGEAKIQGNWGELILERALEAAGLREGVEYKREQSFKDENSKLRADVVLYLPEDKHIVIDAKVSLNAYSQILKAKDKNEQYEAKQRHIISIKRHIDTLASKQYHMLNALKSPEFTLMFIPIEAAYLMALEIDNSLYEYAFERNIAVVTPTTLLTTLKTVSTLWKLANHDKNMLLLAKEGASLHDKFALFLEEFTQIENRLKQSLNAYDSAKNRLYSGQGSLHSKISKIGKLSGKTKKELPVLESNN